MRRSLRSPHLRRLPLLLLALVAPVAAQVDLPADRGRRGRTTPQGLARRQDGRIVPHLTCTVCYEHNYTTRIDWSADNGLQQAWCAVCRKPQLHRLPDERKRGVGRLDLPSGSRGAGPAEPPPPAPAAQQGNQVVLPPPPVTGDGALSRAAEEILRELERITRIEHPVALQAADTLLALGEPGVTAARLALASDKSVPMITGLRVLLRTGRPADADVAVRRLRTRMPTRAAGTAVAELVVLDPVRATPALLCELLDHPQAPVRQAAHRALVDMTGPELMVHLSGVLRSRNGDARLKAVNLLARIDHPEVLPLLLENLADPRPAVAIEAVGAVAAMDDPRVEPLLLELVFGQRWLLRSEAYALLAVIEREDLRLEPILGPQHVEELMPGLDSGEPFVAGVCSAALAGIGFRSDDPGGSPWLDDAVPERLVAIVSGYVYFDDYDAVRSTALQRLKLVAGVSHGSDGPAWADWWLANEAGFQASRAVLPVGEGDERALRLAVRDGESGRAFVLLGPDLAPQGAPARLGEAFFLAEDEARDLVSLLRAEGVLGVERLPGVRGGQAAQGRAVDVAVGERAKSFVFGPGLGEPWFDRVMGVTVALADRNLWQRYPHPERHGSRLALWRAEGAWWSGEHTETERLRRLQGLILERLLAQPQAERGDGITALEETYAAQGGPDPEHFPALLSLLQDELYFTARADRIADLAQQAAGLVEGGAHDEQTLERAWQLLGLLHDRYSTDATTALGELLAMCGEETARRAAADARPVLRAVSAYVLAGEPDEAAVGVLLGLLEDPVVEVEIAAVEALGQARVEAAREELLVRAGLGAREVRAAALRAAGRLGGDDARDVLVGALGDAEGRFHVPAAEGLASLGDASTVPILLSLLRNRNHPEAFDPVRKGLLSMGPAAWDELFLSMRSPSPEMRREAALLLARQAVPQAAPALMRALAEDPADNHVARELAILSCVDQREEVDPSEAWYRWWDGVRHDDARSWFLAAAEARGIAAPAEPGALEAGGTRDGIGFLVQVLRRPESWLVERARRELEVLLGRELGELPPPGVQRDTWLEALLEVLEDAR